MQDSFRNPAPVRIVEPASCATVSDAKGRLMRLWSWAGRLAIGSTVAASVACAVANGEGADFELPYRHWTVSEPILAPGPEGTFDAVAVKDPTIVYHRGRWHLFYTAKPARDAKRYKTALGYVTAPTLAGLRQAPHVEMRPILGESMIAAQVFYFEPHKLWYLVGHVGDASLHKLQPVYSTNPDIENVQGWSKPRVLRTNRQRKEDFWIDFWVICDEAKAHLFYADHTDTLFRMECPLEEFPSGFANAREQVAIKTGGRNHTGEWTFHEASHIYYVKSKGKYLALLEGTYAHPTRENYWDSRNRFLFGMEADRLEGPWRRVESSEDEFLGEARWLFNPDGTPSKYDQVSHPELIRAGIDQRMEIPDLRLQLVFQAFDADGMPPTYDYHVLPWRIMVMRNY